MPDIEKFLEPFADAVGHDPNALTAAFEAEEDRTVPRPLEAGNTEDEVDQASPTRYFGWETIFEYRDVKYRYRVQQERVKDDGV